MDDILIKVLLEANPDLATLYESLKSRDSGDHRVKTFDDCAKVENDIRTRLDSVNPFK